MIKILAIDNNYDTLLVFSEILRNSMPDINMITATNGKGGLELAVKEQPDVILLDILIHGMDGYEVFAKLKKLDSVKHIPIIMLATMTDSESKMKALDIGADAFLTKPIKESEFTAQIMAMLKIKKPEEILKNKKDYPDETIKERANNLELEIVKNRESENYLRSSLDEIKFGKRALLNLMEDLELKISEKDIVQKELESSKSQLRELVQHANLIQETERANISREIHDTIGQALTALKFDLSWIKRNNKSIEKPLYEKLSSMDSLISDTIVSVQKLSTELRPGLLDDLGLKSALEWQLQEFMKRFEIETKLIFENENLVLNESVSVNFFRVVQESLTNIARHAQASLVIVKVEELESEIFLTISDNGIGINEEQISNFKSLGLLGINERVLSIGGEFEIFGIPNKGTKIIVTVPKE